MQSSQLKTLAGIAAFLCALVAAELVGQAQNPRPQNGMPQNGTTQPGASQSAIQSNAKPAAPAAALTREQIWNSPNMLRARAGSKNTATARPGSRPPKSKPT